MSTPTKNAARDASNNPVFQVLARSGFAVNGLLHILIGGIAIGVALSGAGGGSGGEADQSGALRQVSSTPGGLFVLWVAVIGLFALGLWQIVQVRLVDDPDAKKKWGRRASEAGKAVVYIALGVTALTFALGGSSNSSDSSQTLSARLLETPGGVFLLVAIGLAVVGGGIGFVVIGIRRTFRKQIHVPAGQAGRAVVVLGTVGYIAKGIALFVVGVLFVVAAFTYDPEKASGLDGALKALVGLPFGVAVLVAVGIGLIAYGVYLGVRARLAKL
ncbi:DUF1206 domain-containing protein [Herbiconiux solani]|uniref:DUF1206 domain-containing protein n=1 Tax=Herbiconiux solani TaxID=661329 RepID=UPI00082520AA|nr:DUF1206 domain-containing protein [Herbiconiux solani]